MSSITFQGKMYIEDELNELVSDMVKAGLELWGGLVFRQDLDYLNKSKKEYKELMVLRWWRGGRYHQATVWDAREWDCLSQLIMKYNTRETGI